jgi:glycosyltransferase involved in cell wall biosynthesis
MPERSVQPSDAPVVSVIVPAYNAERYLGDALRSLFDQTLTDIEIIVVDDGSRDATRAIAERFAADDARVRVIARDTPSGKPAISRNLGLAAARGRYVAFLDADDTSVPTRLAHAVLALQRTGALFAFADLRRLYVDTGELERASTLAEDSFVTNAAPYLERVDDITYLCALTFPAFLFRYIAINTSTVVFDRRLLEFEPSMFNESLVCFEDVDLWFRFAEHTRFAFVDEIHTIMRKHAASITASNPVDTRIDGIGVRKSHLARLKSRMTADEVSAAEHTLGELQSHVAYAKYCADDHRSARAWYLKSWRTRPTAAAALGYAKAWIPRSRALAVARALGRRVD